MKTQTVTNPEQANVIDGAGAICEKPAASGDGTSLGRPSGEVLPPATLDADRSSLQLIALLSANTSVESVQGLARLEEENAALLTQSNGEIAHRLALQAQVLEALFNRLIFEASRMPGKGDASGAERYTDVALRVQRCYSSAANALAGAKASDRVLGLK